MIHLFEKFQTISLLALAQILVSQALLSQVALADGELDPTFGDAGVVLLNLNSVHQESRPADILIQPDGRIIVVGNYFSATSGWNMSIRRLTSDGSIDSSFNGGDPANFDFGLNDESTDLACCVSLRPGGEILVAGTASDDEGSQVALVQVNQFGTRDGSFAPSGQFNYRPESLPNIEVFDLDGSSSDNVLRALGRSSASSSMIDLVVFHPDGNPVSLTRYFTSPDSTWSESLALSKLQQGRQYFTGSTEATNGGFSTVFLGLDASTGQPDPSFGDQGWQVVQATSDGSLWNSATHATAHYPGGRVVAAGRAERSGGSDAFMVRRLADGSVDPTFSTDGQHYMAWGFGNDEILDLEVQEDGFIVVGAQSQVTNLQLPIVARLDTEGSYDTSFAGQGWLSLPNPSTYTLIGAPSIALQRDGHILVAGQALSGSGDSDVIYLMRLLSSHVLLADGFETGDTAGWSSAVP